MSSSVTYATAALALGAVVYSAGSYFWGSSAEPEANQELEVVGKTPAEEEQAKAEMARNILKVADSVFASSVVVQKTYTQDQLAGSESLVRYHPFGAETPFLRRTDLLEPVYDHSNNYLSDMGERIIIKYLGDRGILPKEHFRTKLAENNPAALQVAAVFHQLREHVSNFVNRPEEGVEVDDFGIISHETGRVQFYDKAGKEALVFTIEGEKIDIIFESRIGGYKSSRTVTVGFPKHDNSVECTIHSKFIQTHAE